MANKAFLESLPRQIEFCGWSVVLTQKRNGAVGLKILGEADTGPTAFYSGDEKWSPFFDLAHPVAQREELKPFFQFYLALPIGPHLLTWGHSDWVNKKRVRILSYSFDAWRRLVSGNRRGERLKEAMFCIAYVRSGDGTDFSSCKNRTKNANGLCRFHSGRDTKHLWNLEPCTYCERLVRDVETHS